MAIDNPFPLNIPEKQDSFEKLQLLANIDPTFKYTAAEWNKIVQALEWLKENIEVSSTVIDLEVIDSAELPITENDVLLVFREGVIKKAEYQSVIPAIKKETTNTGATIDLGYIGGNTCNMSGANTNASYTLVNSVLNGNAEVLINRSTEPTITGATAFTDSGFVADTNQIMCVKNYGGSIGVKYYFLTV